MKEKRVIRLLLVSILLVLPFFLVARSSPKRDSLKNSRSAQLDQAAINASTVDTMAMSEQKLGLKETEFKLKDNIWVFEWQHISTVIIFILVVVIVSMGLFLSYKQFEFNMEMARKHYDAPVKVSGKKNDTQDLAPAKSKSGTHEEHESSTTFEIGKGGIKINSAVIGLIILAMSIGFFFLYLRYVYPVHILR